MKEEILQHVSSLDQAQRVGVADDRHGQFHRAFTPRQIHVIALATSMGSGIFISIGQALSNGGPGNMLVAYALVCSCAWAALYTLCEMVIAFPVSGNFIDYADRWVDKSLAFGAGLSEWLSYTAITASEAVFFNIIIQYWANYRLPEAVSLTIVLVLMAVIFVCPTKVYAVFEYLSSIVKVLLFIFLVVICVAIIGGAGKTGYVHHGSTWTDQPPFKNGFSGFVKCATFAVWAIGDQIPVATMGGEAQNVRYSMAHAAKLAPIRISIVFLVSISVISTLVPSNDDRLLGGSGVTASPYVIAMKDAGIRVAPHITNAAIIVSIVGSAAEALYTASRMLRTMAHQALIPEIFANVDSRGRPTMALLITGATLILLTYINLSSGGVEALNWLLDLTTTGFLINWMIIACTSFRFHRALKLQDDPLLKEPYAWRSFLWPLAPAWLFLVSLFLLASCFVIGAKPPGGLKTSLAVSVLQYTIGIVVIVSLTVGYKLIFRTSSRQLRKADHVTGRHIITPDEISELERYYSMSRWRRFLSYVQVW
ncbi:proline-specific permease [Aspergillus ambiguus]|uniref:proline-specific permease n=1 Tax=Aspergillus ambiguus TaxID=176160 RepID=UPI003CCCC6B8